MVDNVYRKEKKHVFNVLKTSFNPSQNPLAFWVGWGLALTFEIKKTQFLSQRHVSFPPTPPKTSGVCGRLYRFFQNIEQVFFSFIDTLFTIRNFQPFRDFWDTSYISDFEKENF